MKRVLIFLILCMSVSAQSGRRAREIVVPVSPPAAEPTAPKPAPSDNDLQVTAESNQDYRCTEDGSLARIVVGNDEDTEQLGLSPKEVDSRVTITSRPPPSYTKEARRNGVQGFVVLKALLAADGNVDRIRVIKRLPAGLTENAIRAACKIKFKPATKDGRAVAQRVTVEYVFRLADSSIFAP